MSGQETQAMSETVTIKIPGITRQTLDRLKKTFDVKTDEEVLSRALGLANTAVKLAGAANTITMTGEGANDSVTISLDK
jgi:hypothetical protein